MNRFVIAVAVLALIESTAPAMPLPPSYRELAAKAGGIVVGRVVRVEPWAEGGSISVEYRILVMAVEKGLAKPGETVTLRAWFPVPQDGGPVFSCGPTGTMALPGVGETVRVFFDAGNKVYDNGFWPPQPPANEDECLPPNPAEGADRAELVRRTHPLGLPIDLRNWHWWALGVIAVFAAVSAGRPGGRRRGPKVALVIAATALAAPAARATPPGNRMPYSELKTRASGIVVGRVLAIDAREDRNDDGPVVRLECQLLVAAVEKGSAVSGDVLALSAWFAKDRPFSFGCAGQVGLGVLPGVGETTRVIYDGGRAGGAVYDNGFWLPGPPAREDAWSPTGPMIEADRAALERRTHPLGLWIDIRNWYWWALAAGLLMVASRVVRRRARRRAQGVASRPSPRA